MTDRVLVTMDDLEAAVRANAAFEEAGMIYSGLSPDGKLVEIVEVPDHPWFVACQFHPEFKSRPVNAHPLFAGFIRAALRGKADER